MTPLPKKKHTRSRSNKRRSVFIKKHKLPTLIKCKTCGNLKYPHRACPNCGSMQKNEVSTRPETQKKKKVS